MKLVLVFIEFWIPVAEDFAVKITKKGQLLKSDDCFAHWNDTYKVEFIDSTLWNK
jgi:hypothetical protein